MLNVNDLCHHIFKPPPSIVVSHYIFGMVFARFFTVGLNQFNSNFNY
ncbi:hypothetical protein CCPUN_06430 [Cardinium endosymbiont of Culicoides punctatus]|nr:hypothetical protein CCPUN_06430 [Cardinium endosymbiont of Culicoides punctatus]